jgi:hypothetical protein
MDVVFMWHQGTSRHIARCVEKTPQLFKHRMGHLKRQIEVDPKVDSNEKYKGHREVPK